MLSHHSRKTQMKRTPRERASEQTTRPSPIVKNYFPRKNEMFQMYNRSELVSIHCLNQPEKANSIFFASLQMLRHHRLTDRQNQNNICC